MGLAADAPFPTTSWTAELPADTDAPADARWLLWSRLAGATLPAEMETAVLLLSEIVSNAVRHGIPSEPIRLAITARGESVCVAVRNRGPWFTPATASSRGSGLRLVRELATAWGARPVDGGMEVWFAI
jgi:anti-sigma regulatory factor (Ser/Thr protein kinase)